MKKLLLLSIALIGFSFWLTSFVNAQGVGINLSGINPDPSAMIDVSSTTKGALIPRMTTAQRDAITSPAQSLLIFNTTTNCFEFYAYGIWQTGGMCATCPTVATPTAGTHVLQTTQIVWNWNTVSGATGYKWNSTNSYATAMDNAMSTSYTQTGLTCNTTYTLYVWAYNTCGNNSASTPLTQTTSTCPGPNCGTQTWALANLNVGIRINGTANMSNNSIVEKYCYNDLESNCTTYGGLYQWDEAMNYTATINCDPCGSGGRQGICPAGFHIPTDLEWSRYEYCIENMIAPTGSTTLADFQTSIGWRGTNSTAGPGAKMKVTSSNIPAWNGTNTSGFAALPAGYRYHNDGSFVSMGDETEFWSATEDASYAWFRILQSDARSRRDTYPKTIGYSVRCLHD